MPVSRLWQASSHYNCHANKKKKKGNPPVCKMKCVCVWDSSKEMTCLFLALSELYKGFYVTEMEVAF